MITVDRTREVLGKDYGSLSDSEIKKIRDSLYVVVNPYPDSYPKENDNKCVQFTHTNNPNKQPDVPKQVIQTEAMLWARFLYSAYEQKKQLLASKKDQNEV